MQSVAVLLVSGFIASVLAADGKLGPTLPKCNCEGLSCECCGGFKFRREPRSVCLRTNYMPNELLMTLDIIVDGTVLTTKTVGPDFIPFCVPVAPLVLCVAASRVYFSEDEAKLCPRVEVKFGTKSIFKKKLACLRLVGGQFSVTRN